jgi:hypothetical protein
MPLFRGVGSSLLSPMVLHDGPAHSRAPSSRSRGDCLQIPGSTLLPCFKTAIVGAAGLRVAPAATARVARRSVVVKADLKGIESQYKQFRIPEIPIATIAGIAGYVHPGGQRGGMEARQAAEGCNDTCLAVFGVRLLLPLAHNFHLDLAVIS